MSTALERVNDAEARRSSLAGSLLPIAICALLFSTGGLYEVTHRRSLTAISNGDFWWHLRTGLWMLQNHAVPRSSLFSQAAAQAWMASSWLYEVLVSTGYKLFGLRFLPLLATTGKTALAVVTFLLAGGLRGRFWTAVLLSAAAQYVLGSMQPLPVLFSALAFAVELLLLMEYRATGDVRFLYWLPLMFLIWANFDPQFVYGILALLLFLGTCFIEQRGARVAVAWTEQATQLKMLGAVTGASLVATAITPYEWRPYGVFFAEVTSAANSHFPDFQALRFRTPQDYLLLLLAMAAFLTLGMRCSRDIFQIALLVLCTCAAFHSQRDVWLVTMAAVAIVGDAAPERLENTAHGAANFNTRQLLVAAGIAVVVLTIVAVVRLPRSEKALLAEVAGSYPVGAADYVRQQQLPQPMFNSFSWGGFLTWYLPEYPVAIDGRTDLYGDDYNIQYAKVMNADAHYSTFPPLNQAATLVLEKNSLMGKAFPHVTGFKQVYSDDVAMVLVREQPVP